MELPKLYKPVNLTFWSLRMTVGCNLGLTEVDEIVTRKARRIRCANGWKWQFILKPWQYEHEPLSISNDEISIGEPDHIQSWSN